MDLWPAHVYLDEGRKLGLESPVLKEALRQAHAAQREGFPAILTLRHLARRTGTRYEDLRELVEARKDPYRSFRIRKRSGGSRFICVPKSTLMMVQRWLARNVLNRVRPHWASTAYAPQASVVESARRHCGCRWLLKVDVQNFFESVSEIQVFRVFRDLGYNHLLAFELARLCTRRFARSPRYRRHIWKTGDKAYAIRAYADHRIGHLPQGAPTSPMLSNLAMHALDEHISQIADAVGFTYTRYADDLTFSSSHPSLTRTLTLQLLADVNRVIRKHGVMPNRKKAVLAPPGARKLVLGLLVDGSEPRLQREFRRRLLLHAHFLRTRGPAEHVRKRGFRSVLSFKRHIEGLLAYAHQVEPDFAAGIRHDLSSVDWGPF